MKPIDEFPRDEANKIQYVLTDIDDTLTDSGKLPGSSYLALENLSKAGFKVIPITGRPSGWCDLICRMWPVDGVVGENGAFYFAYDKQNKKMVRRYSKSDKQRAEDKKRMSIVCDDILQSVSGCALSADQHCREADLAIDFCEDVPPLGEEAINQIVKIFHKYGACAKISSIHVNGWFGEYDKLSMTKILFREQFRVELDLIKERVVFAGDSPNDEPMFAYFPNSVGVANVQEFVDSMTDTPQWITEGKGGYGFTQLANYLLNPDFS